MRILQLGRYFPPHVGGIETVIFEATEGLAGQGIGCDVLCSNKHFRTEISNFSGYKVIRASTWGQVLSTSISPFLVLQLKKIIKNYDIIHIHHPDPMATVALLLSSTKNNRIVVHWHSDIIRQKIAFFFFRPLQNILLKRSSKIIVTSENYFGSSEHLKEYKDKIEVIPIGINAIFLANPQKKQELSKRFENKVVIFTLGRHVYYKGFEYLIKAAKYLNDDFIIVIGGDGPLTPSLCAVAKEEGVSQRIFFPGRIPPSELSSYYEICSIFALPSIERTEAFGVVLLEAMSFGKPIVATDIPGSGVSWVNQHNKTGLNVPPKNPKALAEALTKIMLSQDLHQSFSRESKHRYESWFSRNSMVNKLINLYARLMKSS